MKYTSHVWAIVAALSFGLPLTACGASGDSSAPAGSEAQSPGQYDAQIGRLCRDAKSAISAISKPADDISGSQATAQFDRILAPVVETEQRLAAIRPPDEYQPFHRTVEAFFRNLDKGLHRLKGLVENGVAPQDPKYSEALLDVLGHLTDGVSTAEAKAAAKAIPAGWRTAGCVTDASEGDPGAEPEAP